MVWLVAKWGQAGTGCAVFCQSVGLDEAEQYSACVAYGHWLVPKLTGWERWNAKWSRGLKHTVRRKAADQVVSRMLQMRGLRRGGCHRCHHTPIPT